MTNTKQEPRSEQVVWGDYAISSLVGVRGRIEFVGPRARAHVVIDDGRVRIAPQNGKPDCTLVTDDEGELLRLVRGEANLITAVLQGRVEISGNPLLALKVAGSMLELGRQQAIADRPPGGT